MYMEKIEQGRICTVFFHHFHIFPDLSDIMLGSMGSRHQVAFRIVHKWLQWCNYETWWYIQFVSCKTVMEDVVDSDKFSSLFSGLMRMRQIVCIKLTHNLCRV